MVDYIKIQEHIMNNNLYYVITSLIIILYYSPFLFFSIFTIFSIYGFYTNMSTDFQFDIKITNKKNKFKNKPSLSCSIPNFDKPINVFLNENEDKQD